MIITASLFLTKNIKEEDITKCAGDIATYIAHVDKLIIFNMFKNKNKEDMGISKFFEYIARYKNIEVATCDNLGEVYNYKRAMLQAEKDNADYTVILEQDYFYDDDAFLILKRKLLEWDKDTLPCVLSPYPKYTCELFNPSTEEMREVKGVHLVGAFINVKDYLESNGFDEIYYQTGFDYDYCITSRINHKHIYVMNNAVLRNRNYKILTKKIFTIELSTYEKDAYFLYYETRNRYYLWEKFKNLDPEYVKIDQKLFKAEKKEMTLCDKLSLYKKDIMEKARKDAMHGIMGKQTKDINL